MSGLIRFIRRRNREWGAFFAEVGHRRSAANAWPAVALPSRFWIAALAGLLLAPPAGELLGFLLGWLG